MSKIPLKLRKIAIISVRDYHKAGPVTKKLSSPLFFAFFALKFL